jgi:hypothetical protein
MRALRHLLIISLSISLLSCEDDLGPCSNVSPIDPSVTFTLIDIVTGKSLIGPDRLYHPDTITRLNSDPNNFIYGYADTALIYDFGRSESGEKQPFRLSRTEFDTVKVEFDIVEGECFTSKNLQQFYYNGKLVENHGYPVIIEK